MILSGDVNDPGFGLCGVGLVQVVCCWGEGARVRCVGDCHRCVTGESSDCFAGQLVFYSVRMAYKQRAD